MQNNSVSRENIPPANLERPMRYPAEDIRFKNQPPQNVVPIQQVAPLVSNAYQDDDDDDDEEQSEQDDQPPAIPREFQRIKIYWNFIVCLFQRLISKHHYWMLVKIFKL